MNNLTKYVNYKNKYLHALNNNLHGGYIQENFATRNLLNKKMYTQDDYNNLEKSLNEKCNSTIINAIPEFLKVI